MKSNDKASLTRYLDRVFGFVDSVAEEYLMDRACLLSRMLYLMYDIENEGLEIEDIEEIDREYWQPAIDVFDVFKEEGVPFIGMGSYRIVFGWNGQILKVNYCSDENEMELSTWKKVRGTSRERFVLPILDHAYLKDHGLVLLTPVAETISEEIWSFYERLCIDFDWLDADKWNEVVENIEVEIDNPITRRMVAQYAIACSAFSDNHEGNWGVYEGSIVIIDPASFHFESIDGRTSVFKAFKKYLEDPRKHVGLIEA